MFNLRFHFKSLIFKFVYRMFKEKHSPLLCMSSLKAMIWSNSLFCWESAWYTSTISPTTASGKSLQLTMSSESNNIPRHARRLQTNYTTKQQRAAIPNLTPRHTLLTAERFLMDGQFIGLHDDGKNGWKSSNITHGDRFVRSGSAITGRGDPR